MKKNYYFAALFGAFLCVAPTSCSNENEEIDENPASEEIIFDNKGEVETDEDIVFSTFDNASKDGLKSTTVLTYDIRVLHSGSNNLPDYTWIDGYYYSKLNIDLNEGAGGEWMYLYYRTTSLPEQALTNMVGLAYNSSRTESNIRTYINSSSLKPFVVKDYGCVTDENSNLVNLNAGSGGRYVYLACTKNRYYAPITGIQVVSTSKDYYGQTSKKVDGRTYYPVMCWTSVYDGYDRANGRECIGKALDFNIYTKKHNRSIYIYYTRD